MEQVVGNADTVVSTTGHKDIITVEYMKWVKNNAIVGTIEHFDNEIDMAGLEAIEGIKVEIVRPQMQRHRRVYTIATARCFTRTASKGH